MKNNKIKDVEIDNIQVAKYVNDGEDCWVAYHPAVGNSPSFVQEYFTEEDARLEFYEFFVKPTLKLLRKKEKENKQKKSEKGRHE